MRETLILRGSLKSYKREGTMLMVFRFLAGGPELEKFYVCGNRPHGENITAALLGEVSRGGGCPRFVVGTWVWGLTFLSVEFAMPVGLRRY
jgi:hypothetical protein